MPTLYLRPGDTADWRMVASSPPMKAGCSVPGAFSFPVRGAVNFSFASTGKAAGENENILRFGAEQRKKIIWGF